MQRIATLLSTAALSLGLLLVPSAATAAPEAPAAAQAAGIGAPYYGESPKPIAKKLGLKPTGGVKAKKGIQQLATDLAVITTYPNKSTQAKALKKTQELATTMGASINMVWAKGVIILVLDNLPETATALAAKLPGGKLKTIAP